jgi:hypothetical protein
MTTTGGRGDRYPVPIIDPAAARPAPCRTPNRAGPQPTGRLPHVKAKAVPHDAQPR